ncbi:MAG: class I SAM-dependent methyltransferase [Methylacidiphilales bacterium]|nr:class I SAM-dependent methyltransferase [Candidatus Methylacidiphilales bacterium]
MALLAYHSGNTGACFTITRDDGFEQAVPVKIFFEDHQFPDMEVHALDLCSGTILDVGAAAGRHSLELHRRGSEVWSLDILPETRQIMSERGLPRPVIGDILSWNERPFDTVLMLMNGIGMVGTPQRLDEFLRHAHRLVSPGGQILCDSIDVSITQTPVHVAYRNKNIERGLYPGQQRFTIKYGDVLGAPVDWLHLDFASLARHCQVAGWSCQLIHQEPDGHYLAKIWGDAKKHLECSGTPL